MVSISLCVALRGNVCQWGSQSRGLNAVPGTEKALLNPSCVGASSPITSSTNQHCGGVQTPTVWLPEACSFYPVDVASDVFALWHLLTVQWGTRCKRLFGTPVDLQRGCFWYNEYSRCSELAGSAKGAGTLLWGPDTLPRTWHLYISDDLPLLRSRHNQLCRAL